MYLNLHAIFGSPTVVAAVAENDPYYDVQNHSAAFDILSTGVGSLRVGPLSFVTYGQSTVLDSAFTQPKAFVAIDQSESS